MVVVIVATVAFLPSNEISDRWVSYFDESIEFRRDSDYMLENLTGLYSLQFSLPAGEPGGIADPDYLAKLDAFTEWFRANPDVVHVSSLSDTIRRLNMNLHGDDPAYYTLPTERDLAAQYLLLYEMSLPYGLDLNNQINVDKSSTRLIATVGDMETQSFLALSDDAEAWLAENAPEMSARATGPSSMFSRITLRNIEAMIWGTAFAFGLISIVLMIALRSWRIGLLSLLPNLIPAAMAFGAWGARHRQGRLRCFGGRRHDDGDRRRRQRPLPQQVPCGPAARRGSTPPTRCATPSPPSAGRCGSPPWCWSPAS